MPGCSPDHTRTLIMQSVLKLKDSTRVSTRVILDISFDVYLNEGDVSGCSDKKKKKNSIYKTKSCLKIVLFLNL